MTRKEKSLWTENDSGSIIHIYKADNEYDEARYVAEQIEQLHKEGKSLNNFAVLYRANAQSRTVEDQLVKEASLIVCSAACASMKEKKSEIFCLI